MRLLRADSEELELENVNEDIAKYAVLSHRWLNDKEEITFTDVSHGDIGMRAKAGWQKIEWSRKQAVQDGLQYVWIDTCCIDKSSSQELSESINSMYRWYQKAECCYVYLHDMPDPILSGEAGDALNLNRPSITQAVTRPLPSPGEGAIAGNVDLESTLPQASDTNGQEIASPSMSISNAYATAQDTQGPSAPQLDPLSDWDQSALAKCEWFTRGWILQEMLAASQVKFFSATWTYISELHGIAAAVSSITSIHIEALTRERSIRSYSIAQRMSWAASRFTTRVEDRAYSLLGLFDVNIGILYGEGERAFERLQHELLRIIPDQSIFAFQPKEADKSRKHGRTGGETLALSPDDFSDSSDIIYIPSSQSNFRVVGTTVHLTVPVIAYEDQGWKGNLSAKRRVGASRYPALLACTLAHDRTKCLILDTEWKYNSAPKKRIVAVPATDIANRICSWQTLDLPLFSNTDQYETLHTVVFKCSDSIQVEPSCLPNKGLTW